MRRFLLILLLAGTAHAAPDEPYLWIKPSVGLGYAQLGLLGVTQAQARAPMLRTESIVFQNTFAGAGARLRIAPAFVDIGPQFTLAPIDVFELTVNGGFVGTWKSNAGLLPYDQLSGTLEADRTAREDTAVAGGFLYGSAAPVFKIKLGPVIAFTKADFTVFHLLDQEDHSGTYWYEASRDFLLLPTDVMVESTTGILGEILDAGEKTTVKLRAGAMLRHRQAFGSKDISTAVGGVVTVKPGRKEGWPTILLAVLGYVRDADRALKAPNIQIQVAWEFEKPFAKKAD